MTKTQLAVHKPAESAARPHLHYLDGLRGLSAIAVVLNHARLQSNYFGGNTVWQHLQFGVVQLVSDGRAAVGVFIVLSGYCLMIPVARSSTRTVRGGVISFLKRRAQRILPPYYCALALILTSVILFPALNHSEIPQWHAAVPILMPWGIVSHILLVHNLNPHWALNIDPPAWTVATEWQIYFLFPTLLLPLWRRCGNLAAILVGFSIGLIPLLFFHHGESASPWFLGLFAIGMAAAAFNFSSRTKVRNDRIPWGTMAIVLCATVIGMENIYLVPQFRNITRGIPDSLYHYYWLLDTLTGSATGCLLIFCTEYIQAASASEKPFILRILESSALVAVGTFSYSLYLIHDPLLAIVCFYIRHFHLTTTQSFAALVAIGVPISLIGSYLFHLAFEKRFMDGSAKPA